jgi:hypothetical protein
MKLNDHRKMKGIRVVTQLTLMQFIGSLLLSYLVGVGMIDHAVASTSLDLSVAGASGGQIVATSNELTCSSTCTLQTEETLLGLFAVPERGYRFESWEGACENTLGPFCTVTASDYLMVRARFVPDESFASPAKALLLLHGESEDHKVWNEFAKQRFNDQCPVIRGGVVLGNDSLDFQNDVYCYRIDFGYYAAAFSRKLVKEMRSASEYPTADEETQWSAWNYEIRAAVLGILARHPRLSLVLLGHHRGGLAAQQFIRSNTPESQSVQGLLTISSTSGGLNPSGHARLQETKNAHDSDGVVTQRFHYAQFDVLLRSDHSSSTGMPSENSVMTDAPNRVMAMGELLYQQQTKPSYQTAVIADPEKEANISLVLRLLMNDWWMNR